MDEVSVKDYFRERCGIKGEELLTEMEAITEVIYLKRGDIMLQQGQMAENVFFQVEGIMRGFFLDKDGREHTECFSGQFDLPAMPSADLTVPSPLTEEALTDGILLSLPIPEVFELVRKYPELQDFYNRMLVGSMDIHYKIKRIFYECDVKERYEWYEKTFPKLLGRVHLRYVASFLNTTPETLSRVRKELKRKK